MGRIDGKVAFITGAARGQGRAHAIRLAEEGADIVALDVCAAIGSVAYELARPADLEATVDLVAATGRRAVAERADVRSPGDLARVVSRALQELGRIDIVCANAGILSYAPGIELSPEAWQDVIDVNLTGAFNTVQATAPAMIARGEGGSIILTSSFGGLRGIPNAVHYSASKHGVVGLARAFAQELAPHFIRVNSIHPSAVPTPMVDNDATLAVFAGEGGTASLDDARDALTRLNALPVPWVEARDVSNAVLWLASDESRFVTGVALPIDAGSLQKMPG
jgi:SDR family mycofactocin-dependent oxidoreductase